MKIEEAFLSSFPLFHLLLHWVSHVGVFYAVYKLIHIYTYASLTYIQYYVFIYNTAPHIGFAIEVLQIQTAVTVINLKDAVVKSLH